MEIEEKVNLPFESSQEEEEEASFASSSMASCSASTPYVPNCGCVKDIDFESEYYFSDAESVCGWGLYRSEQLNSMFVFS